jgi:hypothetical protein
MINGNYRKVYVVTYNKCTVALIPEEPTDYQFGMYYGVFDDLKILENKLNKMMKIHHEVLRFKLSKVIKTQYADRAILEWTEEDSMIRRKYTFIVEHTKLNESVPC